MQTDSIDFETDNLFFSQVCGASDYSRSQKKSFEDETGQSGGGGGGCFK